MYNTKPPGEEAPRVPKLATGLIILLIVSVIVLVVLIGLQQPESSTQAGEIEFAIATQALASGQDIIIGINNVTLYVPRDAFNIAGSIAIFPREPNLFTPADDPTWVRPLVVNVEFRDENGTPVPTVMLTKPAVICFKITQERWADYTQHPGDYEVQSYSENKDPPIWEALSLATNPESFQLCGETDHLSLFALATKLETIIPLTGPTQSSNPSQEQSGQFFTNPFEINKSGSGEPYEP